MTVEDKVKGSLFGLAFGDAYGAPTEFMSIDEIISRWSIYGPLDLEGDPACVTDDTQMAIAVANALISCKANSLTPECLESALRHSFIEWLNSPDNNRAPGMTCLTACEALEVGKQWVEATVKNSKGCGANMRVTPVGLLQVNGSNLADETCAAIAQFQAALTHGHPTALAASNLTAWATKYLLNQSNLNTFSKDLREYAISQRHIYHAQWLGTLWQRPAVESSQQFIARGWDEVLNVLDRLDAALQSPDYDADPCLATGAGWVAEEALVTGLLCFLLYSDRPKKALQRAATTSGDSDSIACLTGAFAGAYLGMSAWSEDWVSRIEYREQLERLAIALTSRS
ncbi:ADP-ribosylglycohydrolase family protein [Aliterella atlantica]|uniref:Crystallin n=1 Tax=Aliterella atlantica CENA595 TaxID=1618023 RepID=A0A0D8ZYH8_9CYAN|nr:ADP-ribosylglycohydrolase family protein [Aliterella atlantica]KJH73462.1 crystallin [Aliterella atlantica CENA595]